MPRTPKGWWDDRAKHYLARLGPISERTGKPTAIILKDADGRPLPFGDTTGVAAAIRRLLADRDAAERRSAGPTVAELCRAFIAWHAENGSAQRTVKDHHFYLGRFCKFVHRGVRYADRPAASIAPDDLWRIKRANTELRKEGKQGWGSLRLQYASVLACWRWAARPVEGRNPARILASNPLAGLAKPPRGRVIAKSVPWDATRRLLRFARAWARQTAKTRRDRTRAVRRLKVLCLHLIAATGCRPFEGWALEWSEIHWDQGIIVIRPERTKPRGQDRRIAVPSGLLRALKLVQGSQEAHPVWAFVPSWTRFRTSPNPRELMRWLREDLKPAAIQAGVPIAEEVTLYYFRHDWQSTGLEVESAEGVAAAAGNSPQVLLSTYAHKRNQRIKEVADKVARARRRPAGS